MKRDVGARDPELFESFFREHYSRVFAYVKRRAVTNTDEIVSETFVAAWQRFDDAVSGGLPWLYRTSQFVMQNQRRGQTRQGRLVMKIASTPIEGSGDFAEAQADRDWVLHALRMLSEEDQEILMLVHWEDLDNKSVARVVGCTTATAAVRAHRARTRLRAALDSSAPSKFHKHSPITSEVAP